MNSSSSSSADGSKVESPGNVLSASSSSVPSSNPSTVSSGSHPSGTSMETEPTQETVDGPSGEEFEDEQFKVWGRLFSVQSRHFDTVELRENEYIFGREQTCDIVFRQRNFRGKEDYFRSISKRHFKISREETGNDHYTVLTDLSSNGTFLNGEKLGKNVTRDLRNNDEIAFPVKKNRVYVFNDVAQAEKENERFPEEFKNKYLIHRLLGTGACGEVRLCSKKETMERFAVKILSKKKFSVSTMKASEVNILRSLDHPCIVTIEEVIESEDTLFIVLELVSGGELFDRVVSVKKFDEPTAKLLFYQMLLAVQYLHSRGITHRDLKPENVLLATDDKETVIKITDFGLSRFVPENTLMKTLCGTPNYLAPEVIGNFGTAGYGKKCDCWSLGCILFICLGGYPPFSDEDVNRPLKDQITRGEFSFPQAHWGHVSENAKQLIKRLLTVNPADRISVDEALSHPWLQDDGMKKKVEELLANDRQRLTSETSEDTTMPPPSTPTTRKRSEDATFEERSDTAEKKQKLSAEP